MKNAYSGFKRKISKKTTLLMVFIFIFTQIFSFGNISVQAATTPTIESSKLRVTVDDSFPRIIQYQWLANGAVIYGQEDTLTTVKINGTEYTPAVTSSKTEDTITYNLDFSSIGVKMTMHFKVVENTVEFKVTDIKETDSTLVKTFEIPNQSLISIRDTQAGAKETGVDVKGVIDYKDNSKEEYNVLATKAVDASPVAKSYLFLNTDELAATIYNNGYNPTPVASTTVGKILSDKWETRYYYQTQNKTGYKKMGAWNVPWTYREVESEIVGLPSFKIAITADANNDGAVDWQDGAIAYRDIMDIPMGSDMIKNSFAHIAYSRASLTQWPFIRTLDMIKKINLLTDGFGQLIEYKGHQAEGHDSAHPDYGNHFNPKAGGLEDFNFFAKEAAKYNAMVGVHINATEAYPEAKYYNDNLVRKPLVPAWNSIDQSYLMDQYYDATNFNSDGLAGRIDELKENAPDLKWVYVDVYHFQGYPEWKLGTELNKNGLAVATEFQGALENFAIWNHVPQMKSQVVRFIKNGIADSYGFNYMLLNSRHAGSMGYGNDGVDDQTYNTSLTDQINVFYTNNLIDKYMQNFDIMKWTSDRIDFNKNVYVKEVTDEPSPVVELYKDDKKLAIYQNDYNASTQKVKNISTKLFIPWDPNTEEKIYHYNTEGGPTTWDLPNSWSGMNSVKLYQISDLGKTFVKDLTVTNGQVTIDAEANTPYVVCKGEETNPEIVWGDGGLVKEPGFDSHSFVNWTPSSTIGTTNHIKIENSSLGETYVNISGDNGTDATLSQTITGLTPGKTYQLSAWMEVNGRTGTIGVNNYGGEEVKNTMTKSDLLNQNYNTLRYRQNKMQRIKLEFTVPEGSTSANIYMTANAGTPESYMYLDDVRVIEMNTTPFGNHYFLEDFESNDEGLGPFVMTKLVNRIHRSETNTKYTTDTINGKYSLKMRQTTDYPETGEYMRTTPYNLKLEPNKIYQMSFKYMLDPKNSNAYSVSVKGNNGQTTLSNMAISSTVSAPAYSTFTKTFATGNYDDTYISFAKNVDGMIDFVIDDFTIDVLDTSPVLQVPTGLKATANTNSQITVNWNETDLATGYDIEIDGNVISNVTYPYVNSGLDIGSTHTYRVRAKDATGTTDWSDPVTATTKTAFTIVAAADSYVRDGGSATTNFGTEATSLVKNDATGYKREAYFKFDFSSITQPVSDAKIVLTPSGVNPSAPKINVEMATTNDWSESTINWNNKPATNGTVLCQWTPSMSNPLEVDVTSYINANLNNSDKNITIRVYGSVLKGGSSEVYFNTKEAADPNLRPMLNYTLNPSGVEEVSIQTNVGVAPVMPTTVNLLYPDGNKKQANVTWDAIDPSRYATTGSFDVNGAVEGSTLIAKATIKVIDKPVIREAIIAAITAATDIFNAAVVGDAEGQYPQAAKTDLATAITTAQEVANDATVNQAKLDEAVTNLNAAVDLFKTKIVHVDKTALSSAINKALDLYNVSEEGSLVGQYVVGSKAALNTAIEKAKAVLNDALAITLDVDKATTDMLTAIETFKNQKIEVVDEAKNKIADIIDNAVKAGQNVIIPSELVVDGSISLTLDSIEKLQQNNLDLIVNIGNAVISIPSNVIDISKYVKNPSNSTLTLSIENSVNASRIEENLKLIGKAFDLTMVVVDEDGKKIDIHNFDNNTKVKVTIVLSSADIEGKDTSNLSAYYFNTAENKWEKIEGGTFDSANSAFTFETTHFTEFAIMENTVDTTSDNDTSGNTSSTEILPQTGSPIDTNVLLTLGILLAGVGLFIFLRKKQTAK